MGSRGQKQTTLRATIIVYSRLLPTQSDTQRGAALEQLSGFSLVFTSMFEKCTVFGLHTLLSAPYKRRRTSRVVKSKSKDLKGASMCRGLQGTSMVLYNLLPSEGPIVEKTPKNVNCGARRMRCPGGRVSSPPLPLPSMGPRFSV